MNISENDVLKLDSLSRRFLEAFLAHFQESGGDATFTDRLWAKIPAKHPQVGDIYVWVEEGEVSVGIGRHFHTHFPTYQYPSLPSDEAEKKVVAAAVAFILDALNERIVLQVHFAGDRATGGSVRYVDEKAHSWVFPTAEEGDSRPEGKERIVEFVWSGPHEKK